jgi:hypothetical protein
MKVAIVANLHACMRLRKSRPYGICLILKRILGIFKPITALKSPWKTAHYIGFKNSLIIHEENTKKNHNIYCDKTLLLVY